MGTLTSNDSYYDDQTGPDDLMVEELEDGLEHQAETIRQLRASLAMATSRAMRMSERAERMADYLRIFLCDGECTCPRCKEINGLIKPEGYGIEY